MPNTLTKLAPTLYSAAQEVSNEPFGVISGINTFFDNKGVAIGDKIAVPVAPVRSPGTYSPSMNMNGGSAGANATASTVEVEITANRFVDWHLTGEQMRSLENGGTDQEWVRQLIAQGMRALRNEADAAAAAVIKAGASRAVGDAGTTPFASSLSELTAARKVLRDNGAPMADPQVVINTDAELNLLNLGIIQQAYAAGSDAERRAGVVGRQMGFTIRQSAGLTAHTAGAFTSGNGTVLKGATSAAISNDTGDFLPGDVISLADVAGLYVVAGSDGTADTVTINRPGFLAAGTSKAVTLAGAYTPNLVFERSAVVGVMRPPLIPANANIRQMIISDQYGMSYLLAEVVGDGVITWRLHLAYGFAVVQPEHVALIMG